MRIVVDTNVLVSGLFFYGPPRRVVVACYTGEVVLCVTPEIVDEYRDVVERYERASGVSVADILRLVVDGAEASLPARLAAPVCTDQDDDKFVACAVGRGVQIIVSGDNHLLSVNGFSGIEVIRPRAFVERFLD